MATMKRKAKARIDPKALLATIGAGKTARDYQKNQAIFAQGDRAEVVFFVERGRSS
jgi:CRP/FNR family cyclic AMP-dependent transcriptional regulator